MKKITELTQGTLNHIFQKLDILQKTEKLIHPFLPEELKPYCRVANIENSILVFAVSSSVFGAALKYHLPVLLSRLRSKGELPQLASIKYYIEPEFEKLFSDK